MILITGANGQLGQCFAEIAQKTGLNLLLADSKTLDIANKNNVQQFFAQYPQIEWCVNCAAYTAVDKAETDIANAQKVNITGVKNLATACAQRGIPMVHYSTDYVYHGRQNTPYKETDAVSPKGVYAKTKLAGERAALKAHPNGVMIIRTSWVYAQKGNNFVNTMLRLGAERPSLNVVFDQIGTPTYAPDLAQATLDIIEKTKQNPSLLTQIGGIWHYSNEGITSWYDFARAVMEIAGLPCEVFPIESSQYPTPAQRPPFSALNKGKIKSVFGIKIPHWRDSLMVCLDKKRLVMDLPNHQ
jgi:dTDP-4-dehydrorhamnose reductase